MSQHRVGMDPLPVSLEGTAGSRSNLSPLKNTDSGHAEEAGDGHHKAA